MNPDTQTGFGSGRLRTLLGYTTMLLLTGVLFALIRRFGLTLTAPEPAGQVASTTATNAVSASITASTQPNTLLHVLLALLVIIVAARALGYVFRLLGQPPVIGEVIAGIALGPSLLGRVAPDVASYLLPTSVAPFLGVLSQVGVILFMFLVGLTLDTELLRKKSHAAVAISHGSIVAPLLLGAGLALWLYPRLSSSNVSFDVFALFMGVAMSITAFPVLARILVDRNMQKTRLGVIAISCAAVDDVSAWCLLALVVSIANAHVEDALVTVGLTLVYIAFMFLVLRPWVHRYARAQELRKDIGQNSVAIVFVALLLSALLTEHIGIHAIFGAFMLGAILPSDSLLARSLTQKLEDIVIVLLLPAFFAFTGMRTQIGLVNGFDHWTMCVAIIFVACLGKIGGSYVAARFTGMNQRDAISLGALMNTRGLMELVVLNIGLDLGVISPTLFAMMVLMAIVTTFATSPLLAWIQRSGAVDATTMHNAQG